MARVFLIEDDPVIREMLADALRDAGHTVATAANGWEALKDFRPAEHELVITDVLMPHVDGVDILRILRRETPRIPVVAISGSFGRGDGELLQAMMNLGATGVLRKPFSPQQLVATVAAALAQGGGPLDSPGVE